MPGFCGFGPVPEAFGWSFILAIGSLLGDLGGAFIKRRLGMERGAKAPILDQYNFIAGAMLLTLLVFPDWFIGAFVKGEHDITPDRGPGRNADPAPFRSILSATKSV